MNKPVFILLLLVQLQAPIAHSDQSDDSKVQGAYPFQQPSYFNLYSWPEKQHCSCKYYNPDISEFVMLNAGAIAEYCGFSLQGSAGIDVALDGASLRDKIQAKDEYNRFHYLQPYEHQILLISPEYHIDKPVRVAGQVRLCGLRGWLRERNPELLALMDSVAPDVVNNPDYSTSCGACESDNGSAEGKILPESYNDYVKTLQPAGDDDRVKLIFRDNGEDSASLLVTWGLELRNLRLYRVGQPVSGGLLAVSCKYRKYSICRHKFPPVGIEKIYAILRNTVLEDLTGGSDFLIRLDMIGSLTMESARLNFVHHNNGSTVIDANEIVDIQLNSVDINNIGDQGRALTLKDYYHFRGYTKFGASPSSLQNINVNAQDGASITGFSFTSGRYHDAWNAGNRLQLTGIHFGKGVKTGFLFTDDSFKLRATGNTGNTWASPTGEHCTGQPASGSIDFTDGTRCQEIVPVTSVEVPTATESSVEVPTATESSVVVPIATTGSTHLQSSVMATVVSAAPSTVTIEPSVLPELPAKVTSGTGTVHKSGLWAGLLSLYALSVYY